MDSQFLDILTIKRIDKKTQSCTKFRFTLECYTTLVRRLQKKNKKQKTNNGKVAATVVSLIKL